MRDMSDRAQIARGEFYTEAELQAVPSRRALQQPQAARRHARRSPRDRMEVELTANNEAYRTGKIARREWTARNRELAAEAQELSLGITLPAVAVTDLDTEMEA